MKKNTIIEFENQYPFKIIRFTETYPSLKGFGEEKLDTNTAELKKTIYSFYWEKNNNIDTKLQIELMLDSLLKP